jgi:hypothetical protein
MLQSFRRKLLLLLIEGDAWQVCKMRLVTLSALAMKAADMLSE